MATQPYAVTASCSPVALVRPTPCLCDAAQFCLWCGTRGNKEHCLDVPFFPSSSRLDDASPSSNVPSTPLSPTEPSQGHGRAEASPWLQCHPDWQQGAVPGACFPSTADGVGEAAGPAWPRTSAPTLSMSDSQSCQGLTGLMIVGAAGQEPLGTGQVRTPASCTLAAHSQTEGSPGPAETCPLLWHLLGIQLHQSVNQWKWLSDAPAVAQVSPSCPECPGVPKGSSLVLPIHLHLACHGDGFWQCLILGKWGCGN